MRIDKICKTCGFDFNGVCGMYTTCKEGEECDDWEASLEYYTEITKKAPWYIKKPYDQCKISYEKFLDLLQQDEQGVGVEINIYDAIEKVYELNSVELAGVLDVSMGVLGYASTQRTITKRTKIAKIEIGCGSLFPTFSIPFSQRFNNEGLSFACSFAFPIFSSISNLYV